MNPLAFELDEQECDDWCWASVGVGIGQFYQDQECPGQQCQLVTQIASPGKDCCKNCDCKSGNFEICNQPHDLGDMLEQIAHGHGDLDGIAKMSFSQIKNEIDNGHPIVVSIRWDEAAAPGHAIVIYGYDDQQLLFIADPKAPRGSTITVAFTEPFAYPQFGGSAQGTWQAGYRTLKKE